MDRLPAASGLLLVWFLLLHLAGVTLAAVDPLRFEDYATGLHRSPWLPLAELALLVVAAAHATLAARKWLLNRGAGNTATLRSRRDDPVAALAARSQALGGLLLLGFLAIHLRQLRWPRPAAGAELSTLLAVLSQPLMLAIYLAAVLALGLHLFHGGEAAHRSLGLLDPTNAGRIRLGARLLAVLLGGGFALVSLLLVAPLTLGAHP
ncbi:MAG: succinate dehydrogenase [Synechococcaceae cyanobacterium ELA739]